MNLRGYVANLFHALRGPEDDAGGKAADTEAKSTDIEALTWSALLGQPSSKAGVSVNIDSALRVSTVLACCRVLAEGIAQLPLKVYRQTGNSRKPAVDTTLYNLLALKPNDFMTSFEMRETMMYHAILKGNAFAYIGRGGIKQEIQEIVPLYNPVRIVPAGRFDFTYWVAGQDGVEVEYTSREILHLRGPSLDGRLGMDTVRLAREAIGLAIATEETHSKLFANSAKPGGILSIEGALSKESKEALKARIAEQQEGLHNNFKTLVLDQSAKWQSMAMTGVDAQHIETRRFQIEEVCREFRVFPQMVMHSDKTSTFASAEQFFLAHVTHSLMPWVVRWEQRIGIQLLDGEPDLFAKFVVAALLRGDAVQRATFYEKALGGSRAETAYMTRNEVRALEDLDPIEGGDVLPTPSPPATAPGGPDVAPKPPSIGKADEIVDLETKIGRALSSANEQKIVKARDHLNDVLTAVVAEETPNEPA